MSNKPVIEGLKHSLADSYTLFLKTQNYHWNVTGPNFRGLHLLFEEQYNDLFAAIDEIAERIRALGEHAPGSFKAFSKLSGIKEAADESPTPAAMVKELAKDQDTLLATLGKAIEAAQKAGDEATADLLIGRVAAHEKNRWMLKSSS
ncbi:MAG: DNA starvation/stationary phase protection protein [Alphaproteobacteria bacterium]|nr:DNA starvation/stationary phase protection protein [Alphaproteobacteria bacterium]